MATVKGAQRESFGRFIVTVAATSTAFAVVSIGFLILASQSSQLLLGHDVFWESALVPTLLVGILLGAAGAALVLRAMR